RGFSQLNVLSREDRVVAAFGQREPADTRILDASAIEVVTGNQRVAGIDRVVETRTEERVPLRHEESLAEFKRIQVRVEHGSANEFIVVGFDATEGYKERRFSLHQRSVEVRLKLAKLKRR